MEATFTSTLVSDARYRQLVQDMLSQAVTGELVGMSNFATLTDAIDDVHEKMEAVEHANSERGHAEAFLAVAKRHDLEVIINLDGIYWHNVRECFLRWAAKRDFIACLIIQEVMLECFAVSMYSDLGEALDNDIGELFRAISAEEREHIEHSIELLQAELARDPVTFTAKVKAVHLDCMTILAEWTAAADMRGHCGVCKGTCMKESLPVVDLDVTSMRGRALNLYMSTLDRIGLPGMETLQWVANLPG